LRESEAAMSDREALYVTLTAEMLERYFAGLYLVEEERLYEQMIALAVETVRLRTLRFDEGLTSKDELLQAQQRVKELDSARLAVKAELARDEHALNVLAGEYPLEGWLKGDCKVPRYFQEVPPEFPAYLIEQRPDLRGARLRIDAAAFRVLAARRASYPSIRLIAQAQSGSDQLRNFATGTMASWGVFGQMSVPVFDGHRNKATSEAAEAAKDELLEERAQMLLDAFSEVENALSGGRRQGEMVTSLSERAVLKEKESALTELNYKEGLIDLLKVISIKQEWLLAEIERRRVELKFISYRIQLLRALGGAWWCNAPH
jgi:outer membrane protein TolC